MAADECSLSSLPTKISIWAPKGKRPKVVAGPSGRKRQTVFGAVSPAGGGQAAMFIDRGDSESMKAFLDIVSERYPGRDIEIVSDNVSFHRSLKVREHVKRPKNITLRYLPPYAPDLNPRERVFRDFRRTVTHNHRYTVFESLVKAAERFFCTIRQPNLLNYLPLLNEV